MVRFGLGGAVAASLLTVACGGSGPSSQKPGAQVEVGNDGAAIEVSANGIRDYVTAAAHRSWTAEPAVHGGTQNSPHGTVRVFFNKKSHDALRAGAARLPVGAMIVKELFQSNGTTLSGYAVMIKTTETSWTWWEAFEGSFDSPVVFAADAPGCKGCHSGNPNIDQVRSLAP